MTIEAIHKATEDQLERSAAELIPRIPTDDQFVDFDGAAMVLRAMGFADQTDRKIRRAADEGKLPFFAYGKKRRILVSVLRECFMRMQTDAIRGFARSSR
jgi:hypothetical protein